MSNTALTKVHIYHLALMILTSIHHVYGAVIYNTPWRMHVLLISVPVILLSVTFIYLDERLKISTKPLFLWLYLLIVFAISVCLIGSFEGIYNHLLKNVLFFAGAGKELLLQMFPPPKYEMPNDLFFELTGNVQAVVAVFLIYFFIKVVKERISDHSQVSMSEGSGV